MTDKKSVSNIEDSVNGWFIAGIVTIVLSIAVPIIVGLFVSGKFEVADRLSALSSIGDYLAGTTFLLALASIFFLISSITIQQKELQATKEEMEKSNGHYETSNKLLLEQIEKSDKQNKLNTNAQNQQLFENSFYNSLELFNRIRKETIFLKNGSSISYISVIEELAEAMNKKNSKLTNKWFVDFVESEEDKDKIYQELYFVFFDLNKKHFQTEVIEEVTKNLNNYDSHFYLDNTIGVAFNLTYPRLWELMSNKQFKDNLFVKFVKKQHPDILREFILSAYYETDNGIVKEIDDYNKMLTIILEIIYEKEKPRELYFKILMAQLTKSEIEYLHFLVKYSIIFSIKNMVLEIEPSFFDKYHI